MQIVCETTGAAARVLAILLNVRLQPIHDFQIRPVLSIDPPLTFTVTADLSADTLRQLRAVTESTMT